MLPNVGDRNSQISLLMAVVLSQSTFHLVLLLSSSLLLQCFNTVDWLTQGRALNLKTVDIYDTKGSKEPSITWYKLKSIL